MSDEELEEKIEGKIKKIENVNNIDSWKDIPATEIGELLETEFEKWKNSEEKYGEKGMRKLIPINIISRFLIEKIEMELEEEEEKE